MDVLSCYRVKVAFCALAALLGISWNGSYGATPAERQAKLQTAQREIAAAASLYKAKKFRESGRAVERVQAILPELRADTQSGAAVEKLYRQVAKAHALLELEGVKLPPLTPQASNAQPASSKVSSTTRPAPRRPARQVRATVSFTRDVAPLLVARCGGCHVTGMRGNLSMASFAALEKGTPKGPVIAPGNSKASRLVAVLESGKMPRDAAKLDPSDLAKITTWIDEGAKFDGASPQAPLATQSQPRFAGVRPVLNPQAATGKESVQFGRDIGPVLLAHCMDCHSKKLTLGDLRMDTIAAMLRGGQTGLIIRPGQPSESLIVKKLRGLSGPRMPQRRGPLPEAVIQKIERWIAEGARFDTPDPQQELAEIVAMVQSRSASHEELARIRAETAAKNWRLAMPDQQAEQTTTENFHVLGNVGPENLKQVASAAELQLGKLGKMFRHKAGEPFVKGNISLYVFAKRYDYGELGTMVERRELPTETGGHFRYTYLDAYAAIVPPADAKALNALLAQQIAGLYVASRGRMPVWFAEGSARAAAARMEPKDARVRAWESRVPDALQESPRADSFITGGMAPEEAAVLSYSLVKYLMSSSSRYLGLLSSVQAGTPFDQAFLKAYGAAPTQVASMWAARVRR